VDPLVVWQVSPRLYYLRQNCMTEMRWIIALLRNSMGAREPDAYVEDRVRHALSYYLGVIRPRARTLLVLETLQYGADHDTPRELAYRLDEMDALIIRWWGVTP
jgi:hypothetical protein